MAIPRLATTVFSTGADDSTATVDVYNASGNNAVVSSVESVTTKPSADVLDTIKSSNTKITGSNLTDVIALAKTAASTKSVSQVLQRLASNSTTSNLLTGLTKSASTSVASACAALGMSDKLSTNIGGVVSNINVGNLTSVTSLQSMAKNITGVNTLKITDTSAAITAGAALLNTASKLGVQGLSGTVLNASSEKGVIDSITKMAANSAAKYANSIDLKSMVGLSTKGAAECASPSLVSTYATSFQTTDAASISDKVSSYTSSFSTFTAVDPTWNVATRNPLSTTPEVCTDISSLLTSSSDPTSGFKSVIAAGATGSKDDKSVDYLLATQLTTDDVTSSISDASSKNGLNLSSSVSSQITTFF